MNWLLASFRLFLAILRVLRNLVRRQPVTVPTEVMKEREKACASCVYNSDGWCLLCSCLLDVKVCLASERCPHDPPRWREFRKTSD